MNWTNFIIYLSIAYLIYYGLNLVLDLLKKEPGGDESAGVNHYEIPDLEIAIDASVYLSEQSHADQDAQYLNSGPIESPDKQDYHGLMALAAAEAIEYTKKIPY